MREMNNEERRHTSVRRQLLKRVVTGLFTVAAIPVLEGCNGEKSGQSADNTLPATGDCGDLSGVSDEDLAKRKKLAYVTETPIPENQCANCNLFLPGKPGKCGGCMLFKGPVYDSAYCTYWAPRMEGV